MCENRLHDGHLIICLDQITVSLHSFLYIPWNIVIRNGNIQSIIRVIRVSLVIRSASYDYAWNYEQAHF